jgi:hypothetical protein
VPTAIDGDAAQAHARRQMPQRPGARRTSPAADPPDTTRGSATPVKSARDSGGNVLQRVERLAIVCGARYVCRATLFQENHMTRLRLPALRLLIVTAIVLLPVALKADDDVNKRTSVTVAFGAGLNTNGAANHHVLPATIDVKAGGVVNFVVAGFHQIFVYLPGTKPADIEVPVPATQFINDVTNLYYMGINPSNATSPNGANPATPQNNPVLRSNVQNRVESVAFTDPGLYLVICNVTAHFQNGMYAFVKVSN